MSAGPAAASQPQAGGEPFDAFHLPGLEAEDVARWEVGYAGALRIRYPMLRPDGVRRLARRLREARAASLEPVPAAEVARRVGLVAERFGWHADPLRPRAMRLLSQATGYSAAMTERVLDGMAAGWLHTRLRRLLDAELDGGAPLDVAAGIDGTRRRAVPPGLAFNVFAGNVPGVAVTALIRCLLVKAAVLGKTGRDEPVLPVLFATALAHAEPHLGRCLAVTYWPGGDDEVESVALDEADLVVVYGGAATIGAIRARAPVNTRIVEHGPGISIGLIGADALVAGNVGRVAVDAALAVALFDQLGCVSPHAFYVERGGELEPLDFAERLAAELRILDLTLPRRQLEPEEAAATLDFRASAEFREIAGAPVKLLNQPDDGFTVLYQEEPRFEPTCLLRTVRVIPIDRVEDADRHLAGLRGLLQTVGIAGLHGREDLIAARMAALGAARIARLGRMPWPRPDWCHDGGRPLRELVRWVDIEP